MSSKLFARSCAGIARPVAGMAIGLSLAAGAALAQDGPREVKHVFVIALENHNWTQPNNNTGALPTIQQIYQNPNAPFLNSLVNGTATAYIDGQVVNISQHVAYATAYHNVQATPAGNNPHIHPSEPNYLWSEGGTNYGVFNDNDPYSPNGPTVQTTTQHLSTLLQKAGHSLRGWGAATIVSYSRMQIQGPFCAIGRTARILFAEQEEMKRRGAASELSGGR